MSKDLLNRLVAGTLADPDGPGNLRVPTRAVEIARTLERREGALVDALGLGKSFVVVSDPATRRVLGARVAESLGATGRSTELVLSDMPKPDMKTVEQVRQATSAAEVLVAVGSGTINDLCKYASFLDGKPYVVFATAPSMNGYTSVSAAITEHGHKKSLPAHVPAGVFLDIDVLAHAPLRMIRAGLGDSICRPTAQADWLLAHLLFDQPYRLAPFRLLTAEEDRLLAGAADLVRGDIAAMEILVRTLLLSGFGMTICGGSYPASQGEHLVSHYIDMLGDPSWPASFHGEHIAVATITMARLQDTILSGPVPKLSPTLADERALKRHFGPELGASCWAGFSKKVLSADRAEKLNTKLQRNWPEIRRAIAAVTRPADALEATLKAAGAPTRSEEIHVPAAFYRKAVRHAREIRDRYTFLDLAADAGRLDSLAPAA
jgi:glycerol-1-phosphate dehydrogenase [NAD(P)+]